MYRLKISLLLVLLLLTKNAFCNLIIKSWDQTNVFNNLGQQIDVIVELEADLPENFYYNSWSYLFDKKLKINILEADVLNNRKFMASFGDNKLKIDFDNLFNKQIIKLHFKYQILDYETEAIKYTRREFVQLPSFAENGCGKLTVITNEDMEVYSLNQEFKKNFNTYIWQGKIPKNGIKDTFLMTQKEAIWKVYTNIKINDTNDIGNLKIIIPEYFVGGNNDIKSYKISNNQTKNIDNIKIKKDKDKYIVNFERFASNSGFIQIEALLKNNYSNFYWMNNFDYTNSTKLEESYISTFMTLVSKINIEDKTDAPLHIKIAKWVNENMNYNDDYLGKKMSSLQILQNKQGVCEHYAILYQDLLRSIGIPAETIFGISYSFEKNKFENHAWVMVYYNGLWIPIDPTWGIYSGKLPISHIFVYNSLSGDIQYIKDTAMDGTNIKITHDAEYIKNEL